MQKSRVVWKIDPPIPNFGNFLNMLSCIIALKIIYYKL
jgi:hypothetical protein